MLWSQRQNGEAIRVPFRGRQRLLSCAYYEFREHLVGKQVTPISLSVTGDGWSGGLVEFDKPPLEDEGVRISLFRFRWLARV